MWKHEDEREGEIKMKTFKTEGCMRMQVEKKIVKSFGEYEKIKIKNSGVK